MCMSSGTRRRRTERMETLAAPAKRRRIGSFPGRRLSYRCLAVDTWFGVLTAYPGKSIIRATSGGASWAIPRTDGSCQTRRGRLTSASRDDRRVLHPAPKEVRDEALRSTVFRASHGDCRSPTTPSVGGLGACRVALGRRADNVSGQAVRFRRCPGPHHKSGHGAQRQHLR